MEWKFDHQEESDQHLEMEFASSWMITYSDMITIMLCFFMAFFILSAGRTDALEELRMRLLSQVDHLDQRVDDLEGEKARLKEENQKMARQLFGVERLEEGLDDSGEAFLQLLQDQDLLDQVEIMENERGLMIRFTDSVLFPSGSAQVSEQGLKILTHIGQKLQEVENPVVVEGYTDNVPIRTADYPSNWELSSARAITVARYFIYDLGIEEERLSVTGYGEQNPIDTNETAEGRANNRRIEITVLTS